MFGSGSWNSCKGQLTSGIYQDLSLYNGISKQLINAEWLSGTNMKDFVHVAIGGGGCVHRTAAVLTRIQVGRIPVPPMVPGVRFLVFAMVLLCLVQQLGKSCDVDRSCLRRFPFAAGKARRDLLEQPAVPIWILKRGK